MKEAWLSSCTKNIQDFVERSTRLQSDKLILTLQEQIDFSYQISLRLDFRTEAEKHSQAGRVAATDSTLVFTMHSDIQMHSKQKPARYYHVKRRCERLVH